MVYIGIIFLFMSLFWFFFIYVPNCAICDFPLLNQINVLSIYV